LEDMEEGFTEDVEDLVSVGQELTVRVLKVEGDKLHLSMRALGSHSDLSDGDGDFSAFEAVRPDQWLQGTVESIRDFGVFVRVRPPGGGPAVVGLARKSELRIGWVEDTRDVVQESQEVRVRVLAVEEDRLELSLREHRVSPEALASFQGQDKWFQAVVRGMQPVGAIVTVQLPGSESIIEGLVHLSEAGTGSSFVKSVEDVLSVGQEVSVRVLKVDGMKLRLSRRPWAAPADDSDTADDLAAFQDVPADEWLTGTVSRIEPYGAFVTVERSPGGPACAGLVRIEDMSEEPMASVEDVVSVGHEVSVRVRRASASPLALSMRPPVSVAAFRDIPAGRWFHGTVRRLITGTGAMVEVRSADGEPAYPGFVHKAEMSQGFVQSVEDEVSVGQKVPVRVLGVDVDDRLSLSMKGELSAFQAVLRDRWLPGVVQRVMDFGAFVHIQPPDGGPAVTGLVHKSELSNSFVANASDAVSAGQEVLVRVLEVKEKEEQLALSMSHDVTALAAALPPDRWATGVVRRVRNDRVWVDVQLDGQGPARGMLHITEMGLDLAKGLQDLSPGDELPVRLLAVESPKVFLTAKEPGPAANKSAFQGLPADLWGRGIVRCIVGCGVLVEVQPPSGGPTCLGLVNQPDIPKDAVPGEGDLAVGREVPVRVLGANAARVVLSMISENSTDDAAGGSDAPLTDTEKLTELLGGR